MPKTARNLRGFTLIELLIVVTIISVLSGVVLTIINSSQVRAKARDSRRLQAIKTIQTAIELYRFDLGTYPQIASGGWLAVNTAGTDALTTALIPSSGKTYLNTMPLDSVYASTPNASACDYNDGSGVPNLRINYRSDANGSYYLLTTQVEVASSAANNLCCRLSQWATRSSCSNTGCSGANSNLNCAGFENKDI